MTTIDEKIKKHLSEGTKVDIQGQEAKEIYSELKDFYLKINVKDVKGFADYTNGDFSVLLDNGDSVNFSWNGKLVKNKVEYDYYKVIVETKQYGKKVFNLKTEEIDSYSEMISKYLRLAYFWK